MKRKIAVLVAAVCILSGCKNDKAGNTGKDQEMEEAKIQAQWEEAAATPYGKYPETVSYTLTKMITDNNSNLPEGDTYENNAYTRLILEVINAQNQNIYENSGDGYTNGISMMIKAGRIADVMIVDEDAMYEMQDRGMLADLTDAYENCASDKIKDIYNSYGDNIFRDCTFNGRLMAIPETTISNGPNLCWVRKDYLDALDLDIPETIADVEAVAAAFVEANIGGTETKPNIGIPCSVGLSSSSGGASEYGMDLEFAAYGACPQQWVEDQFGRIRYGSVQTEAREALIHLSELYAEGILDQDFLIRTQEDIANLIIDGRCGIFFGPWWAPNNPLWKCREVDADAEWIPCLIDNTGEGITSYYTHKMTGKYVVVRNGYEHPEIVLKMISVMFDYMRYNYDDPLGEFELYYKENVDPTARPLSMNVDYNQALDICYENLCSTLAGETAEEELPLLERSFYQVCAGYLEDPENANSDEWSGYVSRIMACALLYEGNIRRYDVIFPRIPDNLLSEWYALQEKEQEIYLKIIRGEEPIEAFDSFVKYWKSEGGTRILKALS